MGRLAKVMQGQCQSGLKAYKSGGSVKHDDEAQDKAMIKKMIKAESKTEKKCGGRVSKKK